LKIELGRSLFQEVDLLLTMSLLVVLQAVVRQGTDYTLVGNVVTFTHPPDVLFAGLPFLAFYRY
jgi:hypothetical protein